MTIKVSKPAINLREKLNELEQDTGLKGQELMRAETVAEARTAIGAGRKNLLINGGFDVWQRGTSFTPSTAGGDYTADRWKVYWSASSETTVTKNTDAPSTVPFNNYIRIDNTVDADTAWIELNQHIEDYSHLINNTVTVSFWAKASSNIPDGYVYTNSGTTSSAYEITSSWSRYEITLELKAGTVASNGYLRLMLGTKTAVKADSYIDYAQVQLELGSVATEFEHRSYGEELALCQRYYQVHPSIDREIYDYGQGRIHYNLPVTMRTLSYTVAMLHGTHTVNRNNNTLITFNTASGNFRYSLDAEL